MNRFGFALFARLVALGGACANGAFAADGAESTAAPEEAPAERRAPAPPNAAEVAYDRAIALYATGDRVGALSAMRDSYRLSGHPDLLYNVAKIERELGRCASAREAYGEYLHAVPKGTYSETSRLALRKLEVECPTQEPKSEYWTTARIVGWSMIAAGVGAAAGALAFEVQAHSDASEVQRYARTSGEPWDRTGYPRSVDAQEEQTLAAVFAVAGGVLVGGGVLCLVSSSRREGERPAVSVAVAPGRAFVGYGARF